MAFVTLPLVDTGTVDLQGSTVAYILADPNDPGRCYVGTIGDSAESPFWVAKSPADVAAALGGGGGGGTEAGVLVGTACVKGDGSGVFAGNVSVLAYGGPGSGDYTLEVALPPGFPPGYLLVVTATCWTPGVGTTHPVCSTAIAPSSATFKVFWRNTDGLPWGDLTFGVVVHAIIF